MSTEQARSITLIADVEVEKDGRITIRYLVMAYGVSKNTIHKILHHDLGLSKKSAKWVPPKLLSQAQKHEKVKVCRKFVATVHRHSMTWLDNIVTLRRCGGLVRRCGGQVRRCGGLV